MFAALLIYQLVDVACAVVLVSLVARWLDDERVGRWLTTLRMPWFARSSFRRFVTLIVPACAASFALFEVACVFALSPVLGYLFWELWRIPVAVKFLGLGAAFYAALVVLPIVGLLRSGRGVERALALVWCAASALLAIDMLFIEPNDLRVETTEVELEGWPRGAPPLRVVVLADLQTPRLTDRERRVPELVRALRPDLIVLAGDLVAQSLDDDAALASARFVLDRLEAPKGIFAVNGDVDQLVAGGIHDVVRGTTTRVLDNESIVIDAGFPLELAGFDGEEPEPLQAALERPPLARVRIGLVHRPWHVDQLGPAGFDLVIAGHTHGGQVVLPWLGPPITVSPLPDEIDAGGLHRRAGTELYVSRGIGVEAGFAPPIRFCCKPEVSLLILHGPRM